jgi:predicted RNA methylase
MPKVQWIDMSDLGVYLGAYKDGNNESGMALLDMHGKYDREIRSLGYFPSAGALGAGVYQNPSKTITPAMLRAVFGESAVKFYVEERDVIKRTFNALVAEKAKMNADALFAQQRPIGVNARGEVVMESTTMRFVVRRANDKAVVIKDDGAEPAMFLHARTASDLRDIARGFVSRIVLRDEKLTRKNVERLIEVSNEGGFTARQYQEAIETAVSALFAKEAAQFRSNPSADPLAAFDVANRIYIGMPELRERTANSIANQQYSTPVPISAIAQALLARRSDLNGARLLDPAIGNASLVSNLVTSDPALPCLVYGVEIDPERVENIKDLVHQVVLGDAVETDFKAVFDVPEGFDFVIANPPFGAMARRRDVAMPSGSLLASMETQRIDHFILLNSLHARKNGGRSVFITGADSAMGNGEIKGRSKHLLEYLFDHYEMEGVVDISGELYKKQGASYPVRMFVVGARKLKPGLTPIPERLEVIRSYEGLREWAGNVLAGQAVLSLDVQVLDEEVVVKPAVEEISESIGELLQPVVVPESVDGVLTERIDGRKESQFQQRYIAFSNVGEASTMIPANLSGAVYDALTSIKERHGDIDQFVAKELQFDFDLALLGKYFSPEQMDVLAMIFDAYDRDAGFLLADQMGVGKGRVLAAVARRERLKGRVPMFVTVKDNLFSDFLERDLVAIDSRGLFQHPLIVNDQSKTVDSKGEVVVRSLARQEYVPLANAGKLPEGCDIVLLTYSQICQDPAKHLTSRYMRAIAENYPITLILDESHNGAGASNTGNNLCEMISLLGSRGNVIYSSGTPIKGANNLALYTKILPRGINTEELLEAVRSDPLSLQEALNFEIAAQGLMISRELDNTGIDKEFVPPSDLARNRHVAGQMSEIFSAMSYLSGDINRVAADMGAELKEMLKNIPEDEREGYRMSVSSMNFPSRLHILNQQMLLALKARDVVRLTVKALEENRKPVIALQHTGESLLEDFVLKASEESDGNTEDPTKGFVNVVIDKPVSFKDLMHKYLGKILIIERTVRYGQTETIIADSEEIQATVAAIRVLVEKLPDDLPLAPLDYLREKLGERGYSLGEISGRNLRSVSRQDGKVVIEKVPGRSDKTRVNRAVREFNNGDTDVLVLTGAGSTGLSVQASPAVGKDIRQRELIKWQMQSDIAAERQIDGRPNRNGQVSKPRYSIPLAGIPADDRLAMMFNTKNRSLTSSTVANRDSKELIGDVPDLLNVVGDMVAEDLLRGNGERLAAKLDIDVPSPGAEHYHQPPLYYITVLTGRMSLLHPDDQDRLYADLQARFVERLDKLKAANINPLEVECLDWRATVVDRQPFMGEMTGEVGKRSAFTAPVYLTHLRYQKEMKALKADQVDERLNRGHEGLSLAPAELGAVGPWAGILEYLEKNRQPILERFKSDKFATVDDALNDPKEGNKVKEEFVKLQWLDKNLRKLTHGAVFYEMDLEGGLVPHVVTRFLVPGRAEQFSRPSDYTIYVLKAGSDAMEARSLSSLFASGIDFEQEPFAANRKAREQFDTAPDGLVTKNVRILDGNLFEATSINLRSRLGRKIVYTTDTGARQHGILISGDQALRALWELPERVRDAKVLTRLISRPGEWVTSSKSGVAVGKVDSSALRIGQDWEGGVSLVVPARKSAGGDIYLDPILSKIAGKENLSVFSLNFEKVGDTMVAKVQKSEVFKVFSYLMDRKNIDFYVKDREMLKKIRVEINSSKGYDVSYH